MTATSLAIEHPDALTDVPPGITVTGATAGDEVALSAAVVDADGRRWESTITLTADADGTAALPADDPLGTFWRLAPADGAASARFALSWEGFEATLRAGDAETTVRRRVAAAGVTREPILADGLVATLFLPAGDGPHPGVALYHGSGGGVTGFEPTGALLASHGYAALVVGWFDAGDAAPQLRRVPVESLARGITRLHADPRIDPARIGALGTSAGAEACLAMAATLPELDLRAVVSVAGSSVVWQALVNGRPPKESRFTHDGEDLPWAPVVSSRLLGQLVVGNALRRLRGAPAELHTLSAYDAGLRSPAAAVAALPLERLDAPLLLLAGEDDAVWPAAPMARAIAAQRGHRSSDRVVIYADTGHISLRPPGLPTTILRSGDLVFGGEPRAFAAAMRSCWTEVVAHFDAHLRA